MKIKTDTAIKVLSPYIGQPVLYVAEKELGGQYYPKEKLELAGVREHDTAPFLLSLLGNYVSADKFRLILKPFTAMSVGDGLEVAKIIGGIDHLSEKAILHHVEELFSVPNIYNKVTNISGISWLKAFQYLQLNGYDLPHFLLGGKTLHESELCIYSNLYNLPNKKQK